MILLIRKSAIQKQMKHASFKFHYDSINSTTGTIYRKLAFIDLNSIMILLIQLKKA